MAKSTYSVTSLWEYSEEQLEAMKNSGIVPKWESVTVDYGATYETNGVPVGSYITVDEILFGFCDPQVVKSADGNYGPFVASFVKTGATTADVRLFVPHEATDVAHLDEVANSATIGAGSDVITVNAVIFGFIHS